MASDPTAKEVARLVTHFEGVLETLNTNIYRYRESKAAEFTAMYEEQLSGTAEPVVIEVRKAIQASIGKFPELNGFTIDPAAPMRGMISDGRHFPSQQQVASGSPAQTELVEAARSLDSSPTIYREERREHESDLAGVIIPGYLPLLDAAHKPPDLGSPFQPTSELQLESLQPTTTHGSLRSPPEPSTPQADTTSPSRSDPIRRRSALRRSSSSSKSPRKVRFDIGEPGDDDSDSGSREGDQHVPADDSEPIASGSVSSSKFPPSMLDDPDEAPPPKKVSSVERLRLLGRRPYKNQEESDADAPPPITLSEAVHKDVVETEETKNSTSLPSGIGRLHKKVSPTIDLDEPEANFAASASDNDDGVLPEINVKKFKKMRSSSAQSSAQTSPTSPTGPTTPFNQISPNPPAHASPREGGDTSVAEAEDTATATVPTALEEAKCKRTETINNENKTEDELFVFDDEDGITKPPLAPLVPEEDSRDDLEEEASEAAVPETTKPTVPIAKSTQSTRSQAPRTRLSEGIGSYMGRVLTMPVVKDPSVYAEAASLGDFNTFVGGIDGASGMDEGDLSSFRASVAPLPTGSPKSFSERLLMEDARLAMRGQQQHNFGSLPVRPAQR